MNTTTPLRSMRKGDHDRSGFSLIEVLVSLAILAGAIIPLMAVLGRATEDVYETVVQRKMRYLSQWVVGDMEVGKLNPSDENEELPYEEGTVKFFSDLGLSEDHEEYEGFKLVIEAFRDEVITGALDEETALDAGFYADGSGGFSRSVSNDYPSSSAEGGSEGAFGGMGGEGGPPPGQLKRVAVIAIVREGETADDDRTFRIMLYLPHPDEESQSLSSEGEGGEGGGAPGAGGPDTTAPGIGIGGGSDRR